MQSNFYGNPYGGNNFYQPAYPSYSNQYQQPAKPSVIFALVNGIDDAKAYILQPNQTAYLKDNNSTFLYEKRADQQGRYTLETYDLVKLDKNEDYAKKSDFEALKLEVNRLSELLNKPQATGGTTNEQ